MKFAHRFLIVFGWLTLFALALYLPQWEILPSQEKSINIFTWGETINLQVLTEFEKKTGIKVNISYYSSNEELLIKMKATEGNDYDLIMPSDYAVKRLIQEDLIQKIDRRRLNFWHDLNPALLKHSFDPKNNYSIPYEWEIYGLGVNTNFFKDRPFAPSWKSVFDTDQIAYTVAMNNDPIEVTLFAAYYLYNKSDQLTPEEFEGVRQLLLKQRKQVEAYSDTRSDYFIATGNCPIAISNTTLIKRLYQLLPQVQFVLPEEGSFITIENLCISKPSKKQKYIYQLLNYLYSKESVIQHYESFSFFPATLSPLEEIELAPYEKKLLQMTREKFDKFHFIQSIYPMQQIRDMWVEVKSF